MLISIYIGGFFMKEKFCLCCDKEILDFLRDYAKNQCRTLSGQIELILKRFVAEINNKHSD